jgi:phospholipid/cholesterol/gamma-HCH transport system substrate-binding protein
LALGALGAVLIGTLALVGGSSGHRYKLIFETGGQLVPGNEVLIGGSPVGSVKGLRLTDDRRAEVEIEVDRELREGTTAAIRATSLAGVANHYVSLQPGPDDAQPLPDGTVLDTDATTSPVDMDQVFNAFRKPVRGGLRDFVRGQAAIFEGRGGDAQEAYKYFAPALDQTNRFLEQLAGDQRLLERFLISSSRLVSTLRDGQDDLSSSISNARTAFESIAAENQALANSLERIAPTFRQSNTTFVNLRAAFDDLDSLVDTALPATEELAQFLARLTPVIADATPVMRDLRLTFRREGAHNDLDELTAELPKLRRNARTGFKRARRAIADFQPTLDFARPYSVDLVQSLVKLGAAMAYYDANGHYARTALAGMNFFERQADGTLTPIPASDQFAPFGPDRVSRRCPGGATQPADDGSSPFVGPAWPQSGITSPDDCEAGEVPPGP